MVSERSYLTVIVVTYNSERVLAGCLQSVSRALEACTWPGTYKLVVWDNGSSDRSVSIARRFTAWVSDEHENIGFGRACNVAAEQNPSDWLILVNPDVVVPDGAWHSLPAAVAAAPGRSIVVPRLLNPDGSLQENVFLPPSPMSELALALGGLRLYRVCQNVRRVLRVRPCHISGALFICSGLLWQELGGFDERYFLYAEELDFCVRAVNRGACFVRAPEICVVHAGSQGLATKTPTTYALLVQGKLKFLQRFYGDSWARFAYVAVRAGNARRTIQAPITGYRVPEELQMYRALRGVSYASLVESPRFPTAEKADKAERVAKSRIPERPGNKHGAQARPLPIGSDQDGVWRAPTAPGSSSASSVVDVGRAQQVDSTSGSPPPLLSVSQCRARQPRPAQSALAGLTCRHRLLARLSAAVVPRGSQAPPIDRTAPTALWQVVWALARNRRHE